MWDVPGWFPPSLLAGVLVAVHYSFLRAASGKLNDALGALVLEASAAIGIGLSYAVGVRGAAVPTSRAGLIFSILSGLAVSGMSILMFTALRRGGPVAATGTIVLGGGVSLSALAAPFIFGEAFTLRRAIGVGLGIAAIAVLSREGT